HGRLGQRAAAERRPPPGNAQPRTHAACGLVLARRRGCAVRADRRDRDRRAAWRDGAGARHMTLVLSERDGPIALVTLNRPEQLNALSSALEEELAAAIASPRGREARALIIRGAGERAFWAGAHTTELEVATPESALAYYEYTGDVYEQLARLPLPSI